MKNNIIFGIFVILILVLVGGAYVGFKQGKSPEIACPADAQMCPDGSSVGRSGPSCSFTPCPEMPKFKDETLIIDTPFLNGVVTSPVAITGQARGTYFYEGSFPIMVTSPEGLILGEGIATADGEWATEAFVPFTANIFYSFPQDKTFTEGKLILRNDNPSGLPENSTFREIPIIFGETQ